MIIVHVNKSKVEDRITHVIVEGHANFDNTGKDIVCSAVSALAIGAINSVELLLKIDLKAHQDDKNGGYLEWDIPKMKDTVLDDKLQLLMQAMVESLKMVKEEYKNYLKVKIEAS